MMVLEKNLPGHWNFRVFDSKSCFLDQKYQELFLSLVTKDMYLFT